MKNQFLELENFNDFIYKHYFNLNIRAIHTNIIYLSLTSDHWDGIETSW